MSFPAVSYARKSRRMPHSKGFSRYSLQFNSANYVSVPHHASLNIPATGVTFLVWSYVKSGAKTYGALTIFDKENPPGLNLGYGAYFRPSTSGVAGGWFSNGFAGFATIPFAAFEYDRWVHWAFVWEPVGGINGTFRVYKNAVQVSSAAVVGAPAHSATPLMIATRGDLNMYYEDFVDEFIMVDHYLSAKQIERAMLDYHSRLSSLNLWLRMEEGTGLTVYDQSGYGNNGSLLPALTPPTWRRNKKWELRAEARL